MWTTSTCPISCRRSIRASSSRTTWVTPRTAILVAEHEESCPPHLVGAWLSEAGCALEVCRPYAGDPLPDLASYDGVLVMGAAIRDA